jgi:hypothetical protein
MYQLPSFIEIMNCHYNKIEWKNKVRRNISYYWSNKLRSDCKEKSTLNLLSTDLENLNIGKTHNVWDTIVIEIVSLHSTSNFVNHVFSLIF